MVKVKCPATAKKLKLEMLVSMSRRSAPAAKLEGSTKRHILEQVLEVKLQHHRLDNENIDQIN